MGSKGFFSNERGEYDFMFPFLEKFMLQTFYFTVLAYQSVQNSWVSGPFSNICGTLGTHFIATNAYRCKYRVVKQNLQVVRFRDFELMRGTMAQIFFKSSRHLIYLLI